MSKKEKDQDYHSEFYGNSVYKIINYVNECSGLILQNTDNTEVKIFQKADGKSLVFQYEEVDEVISRTDGEGNPFLQVNFHSGKKILLTESLVGFKPAINPGLNMTKLPSVVTTPDLLSVVEAIEETLSSGFTKMEEIEILRKVFGSVLEGGEAVGFDLTSEKLWLSRISHIKGKHSA